MRRRAGPPDLRAWPQVIGRLERVSRLQGRVQGWWLWAPCASWPVRGQDNYRGPWNASTPNPILLINQRYDPNTGYANAVRAERYLGNAVLLTHEGYGHLCFQNPSACVDKAMVDYLVELITPPAGTVCQSDQQPFDPDFRAGPAARTLGTRHDWSGMRQDAGTRHFDELDSLMSTRWLSLAVALAWASLCASPAGADRAPSRSRVLAPDRAAAPGAFTGRVAIRGGRRLYLECRAADIRP